VFKILFAFFLWSTTGPLLRESNLPVSNYIILSSTVGLTILVLFFMKHLKIEWRRLEWKLLIALSVASGINIVSSFIAFKLTSIGNVLVPHYLAPVAVAVVSPIILKEKATRNAVEALIIAILGLIFFTRENIQFGGRNDSIGIGLAMISAAAYSVVILISRALARKDNDPIVITFVTSLFLLVLSLPFFEFSAVSTRSFCISSTAGALHLAIAAPLYFQGLKKVQASSAGTIGYMEIIFGIVWGAVLYNETVNMEKIAGVVLILLSGIRLFTSKEEVPISTNIHI